MVTAMRVENRTPGAHRVESLHEEVAGARKGLRAAVVTGRRGFLIRELSYFEAVGASA
jgi:hypothetical protein